MALGRPLRAAAFVFAVVICATSGCGLPDARPDLPPPEALGSSDTQKQFTFSVPRSTAAPFLGIELYYRLSTVGSQEEGEADSRAELLQRGFHRIARHDDRYPDINYPLIDRPAAGVVVRVDFGPVSEGAEPFVLFRDRDRNEQRVSLRRADRDNEGRYKRFACDDFATGDEDIDSVEEQLADTEDCGDVQLIAYALSYGGTDRFTVYSDAVDLGTIDLTFRNP